MDAALKVVVDIQNKEEIQKLTSNINLQKEAIGALNQQLKLGTITQQQFDASSRVMGQSVANANQQIKQLESAGTSAGRGLSQLSYAIDDVQYGFNAIVNNIPQIVLGLGGSAGIAGAVGIAAVAINQLVKHWGELSAAMQAAWSGDSAERILKLAEAAEAGSKAFDKLAASASKAKEAEATGVAGIITEIGADKVAGNLAQRIGMDPALRTEMTEEHKRIERFAVGEHAMGNKAGAVKMRQQIQSELDQANLKKAKELIGLASTNTGPTGDEARLQLRRLNPDLADDIQIQTPEFQKNAAQWRLEAQGRRNDRKRVEKMEEGEKKFGQLEKDEWLKGVGEAQHDIDAGKKRQRLQDLQDKRDAIMQDKHAIAENLWQQTHRPQGQILQGAKAVVDMYQTGAGNNQRELMIKAHKLQEDANKKLASIDAELKKERRVVIPR